MTNDESPSNAATPTDEPQADEATNADGSQTTEAVAAEQTSAEEPGRTAETAGAATDADASTGAEAAAPAADAEGEASPKDSQAERIAELTAESKGYKERMMRIAADFENFRKRSVRELKDARERGRQSAIESLLPVFDNVERATGMATDKTDAKGMADGLRMIHKQFNDALGKLGIERVDALGQPFDPMVHEAIQYMFSDTVAAGLVSQQLQPGYKQGDRLMRPAMVVVSKGPQEQPAEEAAAASAADSAEKEATAEVPENGDRTAAETEGSAANEDTSAN